MGKINIYLVESPMQLLSAIEAKEYFKNYESLLIIKNVLKDEYNRVMDELALFSEWDRIIKIQYKLSSLTVLYHIFKIKNMNQKIHSIFVGFPRTRTFQWFCENLDSSKCILLDEGVYTIQLQKKFFSKKNYLQSNDLSYIKIEKNRFRQIKNIFKIIIKRYLFGLNSNRRIKYDIFTCFELEVNTEQEYFHNNYDYTKSKVSNFTKKNNIVYFYGSPLSEVSIIKFDTEIDMLKKINNLYIKKAKTLLYIPHPSDSQEKISYINRIIGMQIKEITTMAEIEPIKSTILPSEIASFLSTTLYTLGKIYQYEAITAFRIPKELIINDSRREAIEELYEEYEKHMSISYLN